MNQIEIEMILLTGVAALIFAFVHVFIGKLTFLNVIPRSRWLSFSGGVAVAYVFLHILPELNKHGETFAHELNTRTYMAELWVFLVTLVGLVFFYGLERTVKVSRQADDEDKVDSWMLWLHTGSHGLYNLLIGYLLLHREESGLGNLVTYTFAMTADSKS